MKKINYKNPIKAWKAWSKKKKIIISVVAVLLICILVVTIVFSNRRQRIVMPQTTASETTVTVGSISNTIVGTGNLEIDASNSIKIPSGITIKKVNVESGDAVSKGDTLAVVDKASVLEAMETIQEELENLDEEINDAEDTDETTTVKATVSGTIKKIYAKKGDSVTSCISENGALIVIAVNGDSNNTIEVVASDGTISDISVSKKEEVSEGDTLLTIENGDESAAYKKLIEQRKELTECFKTLTSMSVSGTIVADMDGIVGTVNVSAESDGSSSSAGSGVTASPMSQKTSSTKSKQVGISLVALSTSTSDVTQISDVEETTTVQEETTTVQEETITKEVETTAEAESKVKINNEKESQKTNNRQFVNSNVNANNNTNNKTNLHNNILSDVSGGTGSKSYSGTTSAGSSTIASSENTQTTTTSESEDDSYSSQITAFTLASNETMLLSVNVDELDINSVAKDQEATITLDAIEDKTFTGTVTKVSNSASSSGNGVAKYTVEITLPKDEQMKPGMNASATIVIENKENILILPVTALQERGNQSFVYTSKDSEGNLSGEIQVTTGLSDGDNVEITSGLSEGDVVYYQKTGNTSGSGFEGMFGNMSGGEMPEMPEGMGQGGFGDRSGSGGFKGGNSGEMPQMPGGGN